MEDDDREPRVLAWVHRHTDLLWAVIGLVFLIYGISAFVQLRQGVVGVDYANVISSFGGVIAAVVAWILAVRGALERRRSGDDE
ncbi:hypothetical protein [Frondihabitans australicus]|uniref:Uncharacterized protein n=1 Tax=Frondihabitans australicus TaxID=386892 RepID=A0A495IFM4_9MICO|nr:hypothetical protein [Frondihabitans australicus]RKR73995.1 hypothetical protein C8E83_1096 [Frondihabitans australicus]